MSTRVGSIAMASLLVAAASGVHAQSSSASFQVPRQSIDGGAGRTASAAYTVNGSIGQPDAGSLATSATYSLRGGFHRAAPVAPLADDIFRNGFEP